MPLTLRLWLILTRVFAFGLRFGAKRFHRAQGLPDARFAERLGQPSLPRGDGRLIWLHAASLGEASQTTELVKALREQHGAQVLVTTMTGSGARFVAKSLPSVLHQCLPLDTPAAVRGFLDHWTPDLAVFVEADLWPRLVFESAARDIPLALINARPSKSRSRAPKTFAHLLSHFDAITCKSDEVRAGLAGLGLAAEKLHMFGDLRAAQSALPVDADTLDMLRAAVGGRPVWIAASTHADDEQAVIAAHQAVRKTLPDALLVWAPRHPTRADAITQAAQGMVLHRRSLAQDITPQTAIYLADTFGELGTLFSLGSVVFLGGSFGDEGGHNPHEPARFGCFVLTGPHVDNHQDAFDDYMAKGMAATIKDGTELGLAVLRALETGTPTAAAHSQEPQAAVPQTIALLGALLQR